PTDTPTVPTPTHTASPTQTETAEPTPTADTCGVALESARFKVSRNLSPAGDEKLRLKGEMTISNLTPPIDPVANGLQLIVRDQNGATIFTRTVPPGTTGDSGWRANAQGTRFKFSAASASVAGGLTKVMLINSTAPGRFKLKVIGKGGDFQIALAEPP